MQASSSSSTLSCNFSFPLCVSGITRGLTLSNEMVDHDRRRGAMNRQRSVGRSFYLRTGEIRPQSGDAGAGADESGHSNSKGSGSLLFAAKAA